MLNKLPDFSCFLSFPSDNEKGLYWHEVNHHLFTSLQKFTGKHFHLFQKVANIVLSFPLVTFKKGFYTMNISSVRTGSSCSSNQTSSRVDQKYYFLYANQLKLEGSSAEVKCKNNGGSVSELEQRETMDTAPLGMTGQWGSEDAAHGEPLQCDWWN